ncbi:MAG: prepilin-type N-terminal cleavage/methylation domain-containing protein [Pseudomonadota bacterium]
MNRPSAGFGLIELMVALALGVLVLLGLAQVFLSARDTYASQRSSALLQEDARYVLSKMAQEIRMVGMFGCLAVERILDAPSAFKAPISWQGSGSSRSLHMISADVGLQGGRPDWTVVSDCTTFAQAYRGARLSLAPGETGFPMRRVFYHFERGQLRSGLNNSVLLDNVAAFDVSFGVAIPASSQPVLRYETSPADMTSIRSVRIALTLRDPGARVKDQVYHLVVALRNRLV